MSHSYRGWKSGIRVWAWLGEASLPACRLLLTSRCIFTQWKEHEISLKSFITVPLSWFKQPAKAAPTNTITFGNERFNMWTWGAVNTNIQTLAMGINNTLFLYYSLNACRICNDVAYFIPGIFNLYFTLFVLTSLVWGVNKCIDSWKESAFGFIYFLFFCSVSIFSKFIEMWLTYCVCLRWTTCWLDIRTYSKMITTIALTNTSILSYNYVLFHFLWWAYLRFLLATFKHIIELHEL